MYYEEEKELFRKGRKLRNNATVAEKFLWSEIRLRKIHGYKFRRQFPLLGYIVDFYCHNLKLVIEVDGPVHDEESARIYDAKRDKLLKINGYNVLRFSNYDVLENLHSTVDTIKNHVLALSSPS
jgi:very-short-patch-repair endonuclease